MPFFAIQNFRFGLDTRRSEYTSQPGTLVQLNNAHVNEGGEVEKRQAFSRASGLTNTFGLVAGGASLYVFGSIATPGGFPLTLFGQPVNYVRCQHPDLSTAMAAIVSGTTFAGLPFVIAKFADGNNYPYYNGVLVSDYTAGLILASTNTNTKIGTAFAGLVNANSPSYTATDHINGSIDVFNKPNAQASGNTTSVVLSTANTGTGTLSGNFTSAGTPAVPLGAAMGQFSILSGTNNPGVNGINSVSVIRKPVATVSWWVTSNVLTINTGTPHLGVAGNFAFIYNTTNSGLNTALNSASYQAITVLSATQFSIPLVFANTGSSGSPVADTKGQVLMLVTITNAAVDWVTDNAHTAEAVAAGINSYTSSPDFVASSSGNVVSLFTTDAAAGNYNAAQVAVTARGNVCIGDCIFSVNSTVTVSGPVFKNLFVNSVDLMASYSAGSIVDIPSALADLVKYINSNTATTGYLSYSSGATMRVSKQINQSADAPISVNVVPQANIGVTTGTSAPIAVIVAPTILASGLSTTALGITQGNVNGGILSPILSLAVISGGVPPYTHSWQPQSVNSNGAGITIAFGITGGVPNASPQFNILFPSGTPPPVFSGQFVDVVTDSAGNVATSNPITIIFT